MRIWLKNSKMTRAGRHVGKAFILLLKRWLGLSTPPVILAYRGYGTPDDVFLSGHVLDDRLLYEPTAEDSTWSNIRAMLSRFISTSIPEVPVMIDAFGQKHEVKTDKHGYFFCHIQPEQKLLAGWHSAHFRVGNPLEEGPDELVAGSDVLIVDESEVRFGVISDIDDTIIVSYANRMLRKLRLVLMENAHTRLPFPGVAAFYHALQYNEKARHNNPIFYISSSEWNLYDFLIDFCQKQDIPRGIFFLQELKQNLAQVFRSGGGTHNHKLDKARRLLQLYPSLPFILIGDSGQRDAELYAQLAEEFPQRVWSVYLREVKGGKQREHIIELFQKVAYDPDKVCLTAKTEEAAEDAFRKGFIREAGLEQVRETPEE